MKVLYLSIMLRRILKFLFVFILVTTLVIVCYYGYSFTLNDHSVVNNSDDRIAEIKRLQVFGNKAKAFCSQNNFSNKTCFLIDMSLPAGSNRFFVYDLQKDSIIIAGLVAHGSCNESFLEKPKFSNKKGCGCTALGKYKIGYKYKGKFGNAYKLYGLDSSNSNAFERNIVLHSYYLVPDNEVNPLPICNSLGCTMVSDNYLKKLSPYIDADSKPLLLWIFE